MKIPGFNAESALGASAGVYRARRARGGAVADKAGGVVTPALQRAQSCETTFRAYVSHHFPTTVCETIIPDLKFDTFAAAGPISGQRSKRSPKSFRLSDRLQRFQHCRTIALPFIGEVRTTQHCSDALPDSSVLEVYGHPELSTFWNGGINEIPPPYNSNWFGFVGQSCSCCGATQQCPDGSCIPLNKSCTQSPA